MKRSLVVGNWKMHGSLEESLKRVSELQQKLPQSMTTDVVVAPPFTSLYTLSIALQEAPILLAAQNMHWETEGAYTGEVSGLFLKDVGCSFVILGHSERRRYFGETDDLVNKKSITALALELMPIICVGETWEERSADKTESVIGSQMKKAVNDIPMSEISNVVFAYEPVWAIGTGKVAKRQDVEDVLHFMRNEIAKTYDAPAAHAQRLLYGGSVSPETAEDLCQAKNLDGFLVGGASLSPEKFLKIIAKINAVKG